MSVGGVKAFSGAGVLDDEVVEEMEILWWWRKIERKEDKIF